MRLDISVPSEVPLGVPVAIRLRLVNSGERPLDVVLQGRPVAFDLRITRADGRLVWRRLEGEVVTAILQVRRVEPGAGLEFEASWDQRGPEGRPVAAGEYQVSAEVPSDPPAVFRSPTVQLRIRP